MIPHFNEDDSEFILKNEEFLEWYQTVKNWVSLHLHGYAHTYPPECLASENEQRVILERGYKILKEIVQGDFGFKAPGYHAKKETRKIVSELGMKFICNQYTIDLFDKVIWPNDITLIQSHTNDKCEDSIGNIYHQFNTLFFNQEFVQILDLI